MDVTGLPTRMARMVGVVGLFAALAVVHTWPLGYATSRRVQAGADVVPGVWSLTEVARNLVRDPAHLMDGSIFYPFQSTVAVVDHQIANGLLAVPIVAAGASPVQTYNIVMLLSFLLTGVCTCLLVSRLSGSLGAGLVAGSVFAFGSYRAGHLLQSHLLATQWLPLALLALHRYLERSTWIRWAALTGATLLVAFSSWHLAIIGAIGIGIASLWALARPDTTRVRPIIGLALVGVIAAASLLPLARVYARFGSQWPPLTGEGRETVETLADLSVSLRGLVAPPDNVRAPYAPLLSGQDVRGPGVFPGLVTFALMLPALALLWREARRHPPGRILRRALLATTLLVAATVAAAFAGPAGLWFVDLVRPMAPFVLFGLALASTMLVLAHRIGANRPQATIVTYAALAAAGALLALGPRIMAGAVDLGSGLWRFDLLPVQLIMRAPERLSLLLGLGAAVLAGMGTARLIRNLKPSARAGVLALVLVAVNLDLAFTMSDLRDAPNPSPANAWLAEAPDPGAVIDYPLHWTNFWTLNASQIYDRRVVNGTGYLLPTPYIALESEDDLSSAQLEVLWTWFRPRFAVVRTAVYEPDDRSAVLERIAARPDVLIPRARFGSDEIYELVDRGQGPVLYRNWPVRMLAEHRALVFDAAVSEGRPDTVGGLVVTLNDRMLFERHGADTETSSPYRVAFSRDDFTAGINSFALYADYRFTPTARRHPVGTTGVELAADVTIDANRIGSNVQVNGREFPADRGYLIVVLDAGTGGVVETGQFNVSSEPGQSEALAGFVDAIPEGSPVIVASEFDVSRLLSAEAVEALGSLGLATDLRGQFQVMHAAVGVKGAAPGTAVEVIDRVSAQLTIGEIDRRHVQLDGLSLE